MQSRFLLALLVLAALLFFAGTDRQQALSQTLQSSSDIGYAKSPVRRTGILFPRLTRFRDQNVLREVNRQIDELTKDFGCEERSKNSSFKVRSKVAYAERDIFSIYASAQYYCGGPYPTNDANYSQTFDLRTGKLVKFDELFKNYEEDKSQILKIIFAAQIAQLEKLNASGKPKEDSCETQFSMENLESSTYAFNFSSQGLQVQPEWPHVVEACAEIVTVPYGKLLRFAAPDGLLARVAK